MTTTNEEIRQRYEDGKLLNDDADATLGELTARSVNREVNAAQFAGAGLASKVENAQAHLDDNYGGHGTIRVTPTANGTDWSWDTEVSFDRAGLPGVHLAIDPNVGIDYSGSGWAITLDSSDATGIHTAQSAIVGGRWSSSGDPSGWLRIVDSFRTVVNPSEVNFSNTATTATGIQLRNEQQWTENSRISGSYRVDRGIEFVPESVTGGGGSDSFHDTILDHVQISAADYCVKPAGVFQYCSFVNPTFQLTADGATCVVMDSTRTEGTSFLSPKFEAPADPANTQSFEAGPNYDGFYNPMIYSGRVGFGIDDPAGGISGIFIPNFVGYNFGMEIRFIGGGSGAKYVLRSGELQVSGADGTATVYDDRVDYPEVDVRALGSPGRGQVAYHDPSVSGDANTEGPAFYDGTAWTSLVDNTTIS